MLPRRRKNDYLQSDKKKSLLKESRFFTPTKNAVQFGGTSAVAPFTKKGKQKPEKIYYKGNHQIQEYWAMEILNRIGFNTPKTRLVIDDNTQTVTTLVEGIEGYIPLLTFLHQRSYEEGVHSTIEHDPILRNLHKRYKLDWEKQVVIDLQTREKYKISGNLFVADMGAYLVADADFQPEEGNISLVKHGQRFYTYFIDKNEVEFNGQTYEENVEGSDYRLKQTKMYKFATDDQRIFILNEIVTALEQGDFYKIFLNARTQATKEIDAENTADLFNQTVKTVFNFYAKKSFLKKYGENILNEFREREKLRKQFAHEVISKLEITDAADKDALLDIIVEDLRGPYYQTLFLQNNQFSAADLQNDKLRKEIIKDQTKELSVLADKTLVDQDLTLYKNVRK